MLGWQGGVDLPAELLSSLAGAGALAVLYKLAWELSGLRYVALAAALGMGLSYGFWFYSVEVEIYVPPLFFLLTAAWLLWRAMRDEWPELYWLAGLCQGVAALIHQGSLFIAPACALGILLVPGPVYERIGRAMRYGLALIGVVIPAYLVAGVFVAGQNTPDLFLKWVNNYGHLGTWGAWRGDSVEATVSGLSAAVSAEFWTGRIAALLLIAYVLVRAVPITRRGGTFAIALWGWFAIYAVFFAWWQPENLKFWVLMLPAPLLLAALSPDWRNLPANSNRFATAACAVVVAALAITNVPAVWARRDPMADPARQVSAAVARQTSPEDLIVLQAGSAEEYLPFYYDRINVMSSRELWYLVGGAAGRQAAVQAITQRVWHALAKGSSAWIEDRVLTPGAQISDHYVFTPGEIRKLLSPYGDPVRPEQNQAGPESFYVLSPNRVDSKLRDWEFEQDQQGWSGVNIAGERIGTGGWCFAPQDDPNLYGPPIRLDARSVPQIEIDMQTAIAGTAQLFYRGDPLEPYSEKQSIKFEVKPGQRFYILPTKDAPGWQGTIRGLRFDPVERGDVTGSVEDNVCLKSINAGGQGIHLINGNNTK
jgi:hypothetical protein